MVLLLLHQPQLAHSNAYISAKSLPIWIKPWIPHLMTNHNKVYDAIPNLNHSKSQLISTQLNA